MNKISILAIAIMFLVCVNGVLAVDTITNATSLVIPVGNTYRINISVANGVVDATNITEVNITLPATFAFKTSSQGTDAIGSFVNTSTRLSWENKTTFLIRNATTKYFWFNITPSTIGSYNIGVNTTNSSGTLNTVLTATVTDTVSPAVTLSPSTGALIRASPVQTFVCSITDNYILSTVTWNLWYSNSTSINTTIYDRTGTSNLTTISNYALPEAGDYIWGCTVNDSSNNIVRSDNYTLTYTPYGSTSDAPGAGGGGYVPTPVQTQTQNLPIFSTVETDTGSLGFLTNTVFTLGNFEIKFWMVIVGIGIVILLMSSKKGRK
jgi:hypothetical protein